ncbi:MAG: tyrosine-type recombinase/integrase [Steroidobacteraceae bacterium]
MNKHSNQLDQLLQLIDNVYEAALDEGRWGMSRVGSSRDMVSDTEIQETEFYRDWCRHFDVFYVVGAVFPSGPGELGVLGIHRPRSAGSVRDRRPARHTERGGPMTPATARKLIARAGELAKLPFPIHPHMLRHSAGYKLANEGHDTRSIQRYLGHRNITHTVRYTELSPERFKGFWKD